MLKTNRKQMKIVKYKCNLCQEEKERAELTAFYFKCDIMPQRYILTKSKIDECDKHICDECIQIIISNTI
jgi:hypothetical protein